MIRAFEAMASKRPSPLILPSVTTFVVSLLLLLTDSTSHSHVFLPRIRVHTKRSIATRTFGLTPDFVSSQRQQSAKLDGNGFSRSLRDIRGGADTEYFDETAVEESATCDSFTQVADVATSELSTASDPTSKDPDGENNQTIEDDDTAYTTIGILNVPTTHGDNIILLSYKSNDDANRQMNDRWGLQGAPVQTWSTRSGHDANLLALGEINGCLCHGIVLNISQQLGLFTTSQSNASKELDDTLLCLAAGMIRRLKGAQQTTVPISIIFEGVRVDEANDLAIEETKAYIEGYLERALCRVWQLQFGKALETGLTSDGASILDQCKVVVNVSRRSSLDTATEMAKIFLDQASVHEISQSNIVPRSLFGVLCKQVYNEIRHGWSSPHENEEITAEWRKLSEVLEEDTVRSEVTAQEGIDENSVESIEVHPISIDLRRKVESLIGRVFVDVEEHLLEMESKMDEAFLDNDLDESVPPMPEFGSHADSIVSLVSASFRVLIEENEVMTDREKEWVEFQRIQVLKQVVGSGIHRLFHLHLQSLRDHFGHWYELQLESSSVDDFDMEEYISQKDQQTIMLQRQKAAKQAEEGFMKAAFGSIPKICQHPEGELCEEVSNMYSFAESLGGLLEDMYEVTSARGLEEEEWEDIMGATVEDDDDVDSQMALTNSRVGLRQLIKNMKAKIQKRGPAKWYERLAAKVFVIGVNYIQGWIVLQALRREARRRDLAMPKFPLF